MTRLPPVYCVTSLATLPATILGTQPPPNLPQGGGNREGAPDLKLASDRRTPPARRRGSILIVAMWVIIALTGLVLSLSYAMRTEAIAGANRLAQAQADAAERGMEQFLISVVDNEVAAPGTFRDLSTEARKIGDCQVWVVRPDWDSSAQQLAYGLTDEAGKIDLNTATTTAMLLNLPGMTQDVADCILDWRDSSTTTPRAQGAKDDYYLSLPEPYRCKNGPYETVEELLLVKGMTKDLLFGYDRNRNGILEPNEQQTGGMTTLMNSGDIGCGFAPFITVYGIQATAGSTTDLVDVNANFSRLRDLLRTNNIDESKITKIRDLLRQARRDRTSFSNAFEFYFKSGLTLAEFKKVLPKLTANRRSTSPTPASAAKIAKINVNTAPKEVLLCLHGSLVDSDASAIISYRQSQTSSDPKDISWLANPSVLSKEKAIAIGGLVTGKSLVYSGDVVAVSPDGRAFRRYRVVISGKATVNGKALPTRIVYRRDLTASGWPLPPEIRSSIRSGQGYQTPLQSSAKGGSSL